VELPYNPSFLQAYKKSYNLLNYAKFFFSQDEPLLQLKSLESKLKNECSDKSKDHHSEILLNSKHASHLKNIPALSDSRSSIVYSILILQKKSKWKSRMNPLKDFLNKRLDNNLVTVKTSSSIIKIIQ